MRKLAQLACVAALFVAASASAQTALPPVEAYGRLPAISGAAISPDGTRLALAISSNDLTAIRIFNLQTNAAEHTFTSPEGFTLRAVSWADDERAIFIVTQTVRVAGLLPDRVQWNGPPMVEYSRAIVLTVADGRTRTIEIDEEHPWLHNAGGISAPIEGDPASARIVSRRSLEEPRLAVWRVDLNRGDGNPVVVAGADTEEIILNERGTIGARLDFDHDANRWRIFNYENAQPRLLLEGQSTDGTAPNIAGFLPDGRLVATDGVADQDRNRVVAINPANQNIEVLAEHAQYDVGGAIRDPWTHQVVGAAWIEDFPRQRFFDPAVQAVYDRMQSQFSAAYARILSWSRDKRRYLVWAETAQDAGALYVFEPAANSLRLIGRGYPQLTTPAALGDRQTVNYRSRDGVRIPAYLTTPVTGQPPRNLPMVVLVHGGPHARDDYSFDYWASFLASRGYAVLQPNYRGSTGYGYEWYNSGRGGWGDGVMQHDVEDGVNAMVTAGIADANRICIVGASYGGYAALAGATLTPDLFDCAVSVAGVSDVVRMLDETSRQSGGDTGAGADWWTTSIGDRHENRDQLRTISPANRATDVRIPVLLMHGREDTVVPIAQSRIMRDRLQQAGKNVRYVELAGDDHWLSNPVTRTQMLREMETFLGQHIGPNAAQ